jgi:hypothetical protein
MNNIFNQFNAEEVFSTDNPLIKTARKTHSLFATAFDKTARMQLAFGEELLDLNKKRFAALYAGDSLQDTIASHQDLVNEAGNRATDLNDEIQKVASELQTGILGAANEWLNVATEAVSDIGKSTAPAKTTKASKKAA